MPQDLSYAEIRVLQPLENIAILTHKSFSTEKLLWLREYHQKVSLVIKKYNVSPPKPFEPH